MLRFLILFDRLLQGEIGAFPSVKLIHVLYVFGRVFFMSNGGVSLRLVSGFSVPNFGRTVRRFQRPSSGRVSMRRLRRSLVGPIEGDLFILGT